MRRYLPLMIALMMIAITLPSISGYEQEAIPTRAEGNSLYVSESGSTWSVIKDAVANATSGDTIYIAPGNYTKGFLLLTDDVDIIGNSTEGDVNIRHTDSNAVVGISSDNSEISGLTIVEDGEHLYCMMVSQCRNITLSDVTIESATSSSLYITDSTNAVLENINIDSGAREALRIRDMDGLTLENFEFVSDEATEAVIFNDAAYSVEISNGTIDMEYELSTVFQADGGIGVTLDNITSTYQHEFFNMTSGDVISYDTFFGFDDVVITSGSINDTFTAYVKKNVKTIAEARNGSMYSAFGVEMNVSTSRGIAYRTSHFGGTDAFSDLYGEFMGVINFPYFNTTGGGHLYTPGTTSIEAYYPEADMNETVILDDIDLTNTDDILIEFRDLWLTNGTVFGKVTFEGGPLDGMNVSNGSAYLWPYDVDTPFARDHELAIEYSIINGTFIMEDLIFSYYYQIWVFPNDTVEGSRIKTGYTFDARTVHHHWVHDIGTEVPIERFQKMENYPDTFVNFTIQYFEFVPPTNGSISGTIKYEKGPNADLVAPNVTVLLFDLNETRIGETESDENGNYSFENIEYGLNFEIRAIPSDIDLGINNNKTGYLFWDGSAFNHFYNLTTHTSGTTHNISLKYYKYIPPAVHHPRVAIIDSNNEPLEHVLVTVTIGEDDYRAVTDENGIAEFMTLTGLDFPDGSKFTAEGEGYETIEWEEGDSVPKMEKEEGRDDDLVLILVLSAMMIAVLVFAFILIFAKKKQVPDTEE